MRNKLRSFLTALGIIIGVAAVIAMVAIGDGAKAMVEKSFAAMGSNLLIVMSGTTTAGGAHGGFGSMPTLTWDDLAAIQREVPSIQYAAPQLRTTAPGDHRGDELDDQRHRHDGRLLLGAQLADRVGRDVRPVRHRRRDQGGGAGPDRRRQAVRRRRRPDRPDGAHPQHPVPGRRRAGAQGPVPMGQDYDDGVFIPSTTYMTKIQGGLQEVPAGDDHGERAFGGRDVEGRSGRSPRCCASATTCPGRPTTTSRSATWPRWRARSRKGTKTLTTLLASIAAVSLLVGGVGIMNIMLVSVTERTREIGAAHGGRRAPLRHPAQFLVEALTLSIAGGIVGVASGLGVAQQLASRFAWPLLIRPQIIIIAVGFSAVVGIGFGLYPGAQGVAPGSDRGAAVRMMTATPLIVWLALAARAVTLAEAERAAECRSSPRCASAQATRRRRRARRAGARAAAARR